MDHLHCAFGLVGVILSPASKWHPTPARLASDTLRSTRCPCGPRKFCRSFRPSSHFNRKIVGRIALGAAHTMFKGAVIGASSLHGGTQIALQRVLFGMVPFGTTTGCVLCSRTRVTAQLDNSFIQLSVEEDGISRRSGKIMSLPSHYATHGLTHPQFDALSREALIPATWNGCNGLTAHRNPPQQLLERALWVRWGTIRGVSGTFFEDGQVLSVELLLVLRWPFQSFRVPSHSGGLCVCSGPVPGPVSLTACVPWVSFCDTQRAV